MKVILIEFDHGLSGMAKANRDAGWAAYARAGIEENFMQSSGVETCAGDGSRTFLLLMFINQDSFSCYGSISPQTGRIGYQFCSYNEGKEASDLLEVAVDKFDSAYLDEYEKQNGAFFLQWAYFAPDFDPNS